MSYIRKEFRVCVTSQLPLEDIDEYLFGGAPDTTTADGGGGGRSGNTGSRATGAMLPPRSQFKIISVLRDVEENEEGID